MKKRKVTHLKKIAVVFYYRKYFLYNNNNNILITFLMGIYSYIPENNHVSGVYSVASVLYLQFVLHAMLFRP